MLYNTNFKLHGHYKHVQHLDAVLGLGKYSSSVRQQNPHGDDHISESDVSQFHACHRQQE